MGEKGVSRGGKRGAHQEILPGMLHSSRKIFYLSILVFSSLYSTANQLEIILESYGKLTYILESSVTEVNFMAPRARRYANRANKASTSERLEARVPREQKLFFQRAAALRGVSLTDFMIESLHTAAVLTIEEHDVLRLSLEDKRRFVDGLMNPPAPNEALKRAAERHQRMQGR